MKRIVHHHRPSGTRRRDQLGASLVEYALLLALIAAVCIGSVQYFGRSNDSGLKKSENCIREAYAGNAIPAEC